jgi:hypothetical protein
MFILGIISNFLILFFGFSPNFLSYLKLDSIKIKEIKLSLTVIIYLSYVFLNIFFAVIGLKSLELLQKQVEFTDAFFSSKLRWKRVILYFCLFMLLIYFSALYVKQKNMKIDQKKHTKSIVEIKKFAEDKYKLIVNCLIRFIISFFPYLLFILNAFIILGFYWDIIYVQKLLGTNIDKEYFFIEEETVSFLV